MKNKCIFRSQISKKKFYGIFKPIKAVKISEFKWPENVKISKFSGEISSL